MLTQCLLHAKESVCSEYMNCAHYCKSLIVFEPQTKQLLNKNTWVWIL